jgi:hypothetical protein
MTPQSTFIPRRPNAQDSTSSCQKVVVHHENFLPRRGARLSVTFGPPLSPAVVRATMASASASGMAWCDNGERKEQSTGMPVKMDAEAEVKVRIALTELMHHCGGSRSTGIWGFAHWVRHMTTTMTTIVHTQSTRANSGKLEISEISDFYHITVTYELLSYCKLTYHKFYM